MNDKSLEMILSTIYFVPAWIIASILLGSGHTTDSWISFSYPLIIYISLIFGTKTIIKAYRYKKRVDLN